MKTTPFFSRAAILAAITLGATALSAHADLNAPIPLATQDFGHMNDLMATSTALLDHSNSYYYRISGKVHGTGAYAPFVPMGTDLATLLDSFQPGSSASLSGVKANVGGAFPFEPLPARTYHGTRNGAEFFITLHLGIDADGRVHFDVTNVSVTFFGQPVEGTVVFENGAEVAMGVTPKVKMTVGTRMVGEGVPTHEIVIKVDKVVNPNAPAKVHFATADVTAHAGMDYTQKAGDLTFAPGVTSQMIHIPIANDAVHETAEKFKVNLSAPVGALLGAIQTTVVTIKAND